MSEPRRIGKVYNIPPQPPVPEHTRYLQAGAITIGVEYRALDPESLVETYKDNPAYLKEMLDSSPEGGFSDEGVSLHVCGTDDGWEYLRFDVFDDEPHYHYVPKGEQILNNFIDFDPIAHGPMLPWALERIRTRLPEMLPHANGGYLVPQLDQATLDRVVGEVEALVKQARGDAKAVRAALKR